LVRGPLTPFSYSILAEIAGRAWRQHFDALGFDPMPSARILRQYQGCPYLNLTISAQRDAEYAGIEPLTFHLDGQPFPVSKFEKPGFLAGIKHTIAQNRVEHSLKQLAADMGAITQHAQVWYTKILGLRWTQAEVLQIMEEIEAVGVHSFQAFFAARHHLDLSYNRLLRLATRGGAPANLALVDALFDNNTGLVEQALEDKLHSLGQMVAEDESALSWLSAGAYGNWEQTAPDRLSAAMTELLDVYGHRCADEGETRTPRWQQNPAPLFQHILDAARKRWRPSSPTTRQGASQFLETIGPNQRKDAQQWIQKAQQLRILQSQALHAFAFVLAGAHRWALAAARDALVDQRLLAADDVFFFELEEMKRMMTGEWNVSDRGEIQARGSQRQEEFARWQGLASVPELLIGETEARCLATGSALNSCGGVSSTWSMGRLLDRVAVDG
jgi:pyruvate,water dikinase